MKILFFLMLCFTTVLGHGASLKIFSMNLHCGLDDWQGRMNTVIEEIIKTNPDIIGLQEVCYNDEMNMTNYIVNALKSKKYPVKFFKTTDTHRSFIKYQEQLLIITKRDVLASVDSSLPSVRFFENRFVAIQLAEGWFITSHFHFALPQVRELQYGKISKNFSNKDAVIFGDLNSNPRDTETNVFHQNNWEHFFPGPSYPSNKPEKTFDGFWTTASFSKKMKTAKAKLLFQGLENQPSDHLGVFMELSLNK